MRSVYGLLRERCGLSLREASAFHRVPMDTVTAWSSGRRRAPAGVLAELRQLYARIDASADAIIQLSKEHDGTSEIEIGLSADDQEAQSIGWPCVGAHAAAIGLAAMGLDVPLAIVARGTTIATAVAADMNDAK